MAPPPAFLLSQMAKKQMEDSLFLRWDPDEAFASAIDAYRITVLRNQDIVVQTETMELSTRIQNLLPGTTYSFLCFSLLIIASRSKHTPPSDGVILLLFLSPRSRLFLT